MKRNRLLAAVWLAAAARTFAQQPTSLRELLTEADASNPEVRVAEKEFRAATYMRAQATALPDPVFTLQELSVGSPRPGAGLSHSNFAYGGVGVSQELPYPGKLRLKGIAADAAAHAQNARIGGVRSEIAEQVKTNYVRLAYLQSTLTLLNESRSTLSEVIESQLASYRAGQGSEAAILKAQLARTKLLREITMHHEQVAQIEANLKRLTNRSQDSLDIVAEELVESQIRQPSIELPQLIEQKNPTLIADDRTIAQRESELSSLELASRPDFNIGYMFERTGFDFPAYSVVTVNVTLPRRKRVEAERAEASERLATARLTREGQREQQVAEAHKQYATLEGTQEELKEYREGILPQAEAAYDSAVTALRSNEQPLDAVLNSFAEVLELKREFEQVLLEHEIAVVELETVTGEGLR